MSKCGIYFILNKKTNQLYIGQSINIERRFYQHKKGYSQSRIDNSIKKYGEENFIFGVIEELPIDKKILDKREMFWIKKYDTYKNPIHYNLTPGGDFCPSLVPEIAKTMNKDKKGIPRPKTVKEKIRKKLLGRKFSKERKENLRKNSSKYWEGKKFSESHKKNISKSRKNKGLAKGEKNPMFGKKHSIESLKKMSISSGNTSGYFRVNKKRDKTCKQGFYWRYMYLDGKKQKSIQSVDIKKLEKKVKEKGLPWFKIEKEE